MDQAKTLKWCVVGFKFGRTRYELLGQWMTEKGLSHQLEFIELAPTEFTAEFTEILNNYDQVRIESPHGLSTYAHFKRHEAMMSQLKSVDCVVKDDLGQWWCRSLTYKSLCEALQGVGERIELERPVLIVGAGSSARAALAACAKMGFKKFNITNKYDDQGLELIREMKENFFGLDFEFIPQHRLTLLPGSNCIAINTTPNDPSNDLLNELYYFNFLKKNGVVVELNFSPMHTQLIRESLEIKNFVIYGYELAAISDAYWLEWVTQKSLNKDVILEEIKNFYRINLSSRPEVRTPSPTNDEKIK